MPVASKKVEFTGGKLIETPSGGVAGVITTIADTLATAKECVHGQFKVNPTTVDLVVAMGNIATAKVMIIATDGPILVKLNGSDDEISVDKTVVWFGEITGLELSNESTTDVRTVEVYFATDTN